MFAPRFLPVALLPLAAANAASSAFAVSSIAAQKASAEVEPSARNASLSFSREVSARLRSRRDACHAVTRQ